MAFTRNRKRPSGGTNSQQGGHQVLGKNTSKCEFELVTGESPPNRKKKIPRECRITTPIAILVLFYVVISFMDQFLRVGSESGSNSRDSSYTRKTSFHGDALLDDDTSPRAQSQSSSTSSNIILRRTDSIYAENLWDGAPIVLEDYRLIFFTIPKVGCTVFKQLFRRMMGYEDWFGQLQGLPHDPKKNGLRYLYHYPIEQANAMLTSPSYTKAIFTRDPKVRFLSAYLDKAVHNSDFVHRRCCLKSSRRRRECDNNAFAESMEAFLSFSQTCQNPHWKPQAHRMEDKYWPYINFVGHLETADIDIQRLLKQLGVWEEFGQSGWGDFKNESVFSSVSVGHATGADRHLAQYYTSKELEERVEEVYEIDYMHPVLNLTLHKIFKSA